MWTSEIDPFWGESVNFYLGFQGDSVRDQLHSTSLCFNRQPIRLFETCFCFYTSYTDLATCTLYLYLSCFAPPPPILPVTFSFTWASNSFHQANTRHRILSTDKHISEHWIKQITWGGLKAFKMSSSRRLAYCVKLRSSWKSCYQYFFWIKGTYDENSKDDELGFECLEFRRTWLYPMKQLPFQKLMNKGHCFKHIGTNGDFVFLPSQVFCVVCLIQVDW